MLFFQNLVDETQMPKPQKYTDTFILTKKLFIVGLRGLQNISIPVERPCKCGQIYGLAQKIWNGTKHFGTCKRTRHMEVAFLLLHRV